MSQPTCDWKGASGNSYTFYIFSLPCTLDPDQDGNYIYVRRNAENRWVPIYIGEGDLADRSNLNQHHKGECIRSRGATHFHCHKNASQSARSDEEADLLANYTAAYLPYGCNSR